ncbi:hypothetical protein [Bacillus sp. FJAT-27445]|uniref:hypothetical protein n=1 Tax=Bacillus sp. FJAT-27445 TaxID=1679166 RepID=UPI000743E6BA|nr:hypothetical protein [Bacillus sp. FJAT-27445]
MLVQLIERQSTSKYKKKPVFSSNSEKKPAFIYDKSKVVAGLRLPGLAYASAAVIMAAAAAAAENAVLIVVIAAAFGEFPVLNRVAVIMLVFCFSLG